MLTVAVLGAGRGLSRRRTAGSSGGQDDRALARLALAAGRPVRTDVLLDDLWGEPTGSQHPAVQGLPAAPRARGQGAGRRHGERVCARRAARGGRRLARGPAGGGQRGRPRGRRRCAARSIGASREWRCSAARCSSTRVTGPTVHRSRLEEVRLSLLEDAMAARVELGAGAGIVAELDTLVRTHPLREALWAALITALYRAGRQADALAAYARLRRLLVDELGIEPGCVAAGARAGGAAAGPPARAGRRASDAAAREHAAARSAADRPGASTSPRSSRRSASHRLVTVTGPAGVGKTRLAMEVAHRLTPPGGVWLVRLDAVDADASLSQVVADTLQVTGGPPALPERLASVETVLLLDNCEHVVEPLARLVHRCSTPRPSCGCWPPARRRWVSRTSGDTSSNRCHPGAVGRAVRPAGAGAAPPLRARSRDHRRWSRRSAARWTGCRWPSSSRPRGCGRCPCATSPVGWTTGSPSSVIRAAVVRSGDGPWPERSPGATSCSSRTTSAGSGRCPASRAARRWRRPNR